jgi:hypothetical protein
MKIDIELGKKSGNTVIDSKIIISNLNSKELENMRALLSSILQYGQFSNKDQLLKELSIDNIIKQL